MISKEANVVTDEWTGYIPLKKQCHSSHEFVYYIGLFPFLIVLYNTILK